jgi:ABC-type lipoprotein release transport system permease subunit
MSRESIRGSLGPKATFRLAWRNLARNGKRTGITAMTVALAVMLLQIMASMLVGLERQSFDNLINYQTGHAKVFAAGYFEERDELSLDYRLAGLDALQRDVRTIPGVAAATPRLTFSAMISDGVDQLPVLGTGIDVQSSDADVFRVPQAVVSGEYLRPDDEGMLLGSGLAKFFDTEPGDYLTIVARTKSGAYEAMDLPVTGIIGTGNPAIDQNSFLIPLKTAQYMLDMADEATELAVRFTAAARESGTLRRLNEAVSRAGGLDVRGWREVEEDFMALVQTKRTGQIVFMGLFILIALVGVTNTVLMAAFERTREIGMLMAMGLRGTGIRRLFLVEGAMTGLVGGAAGTALELTVIAYFAINGLDLTAMYGEMDIGYPVKDVVYFAIQPVRLIVTWLITGVLAAVASYYPAARASRQDPVEALRYV